MTALAESYTFKRGRRVYTVTQTGVREWVVSDEERQDTIRHRPETVCLARKYKGGLCQKNVVKGKDRCILHGGMSASGEQSGRYKTGMQSKYLPEKLREKAEELRSKPFDDFGEELLALRALLWHRMESIKAEDAITAENLAVVGDLIKTISNVAGRWIDMVNSKALTIVEVQAFQAGIVSLLCKYVDEDKQKDMIADLGSMWGMKRDDVRRLGDG